MSIFLTCSGISLTCFNSANQFFLDDFTGPSARRVYQAPSKKVLPWNQCQIDCLLCMLKVKTPENGCLDQDDGYIVQTRPAG